MGFVATVVEFLRSVVEGEQAPEVKADRGGDDLVTGYHFAPPGDDSQPLAGDAAYLGSDEGSGRAQILGYQDPESTPSAGAGEKRIYARSGPGVVACEVWLKADGSIVITGGEILIGSAGAGQFVALADLVATELNTLKNAIASAPVVPLDGGASFKAALVASLTAWPGSVAAEKVKAE